MLDLWHTFVYDAMMGTLVALGAVTAWLAIPARPRKVKR